MTYSTSAPPALLYGSLPGAPRFWTHSSADAGTAADADGFITNGVALGMQVNDIVFHRNTGDNVVTTHRVAARNSNGSVDLADGTAFASGTDSD